MALPIKRVPRRTEQERMSRLETLYNIDVERNRFKVCAYEPSLDGLAAAELSSAMKVPTGSVWQTGVGVCYEDKHCTGGTGEDLAGPQGGDAATLLEQFAGTERQLGDGGSAARLVELGGSEAEAADGRPHWQDDLQEAGHR
eukprot:gnl/TRDRNA2_/TRDRNA2_37983_c0_seq2.p1 gnl/TRDRNA2_/TRDRNA2_37983_c0~~gnl/TRDRNA2_/TRDRNA2_37983_c0_seq2.p1  ORF type:complete len:142 (+),score=21.48 gnl/TRDRNA2_/TRDRNA2_37983_c0_seq2:33-458(+)